MFDHVHPVRLDRVDVDSLWRQPCLAYNLQVTLSPESADRLWQLVSDVVGSDPALLACPPRTYHVSVLNLLPVRDPDLDAKRTAWQRHGARWQRQAAIEIGQTPSYEIELTSLVATGSAVIAAAVDSAPTVELRRRLQAALGLDPGSVSELTHVSLVRYGGQLSEPDRLRRLVEQAEFGIQVTVDRLRLVRETLYPSIGIDLIAEFSLAGST